MLSIPVVGAGRTAACIALSFDLPLGSWGLQMKCRGYESGTSGSHNWARPEA